MAGDEEVEAVARALCAHANGVEKRSAAVEGRRAVFLDYEDWRDEYDAEAADAIAALDRVRSRPAGGTEGEDHEADEFDKCMSCGSRWRDHREGCYFA